MPSQDRLLAFMATALVVIVIPGPSVLFVVSRALASGRRVAVWSIVGNALGEYVQVVAVAFGIGALAERSVAAFTALKLVGGAYLVYLGTKTFRQRRSLAAAFGRRPSGLRTGAPSLKASSSGSRTRKRWCSSPPSSLSLSTAPAATYRARILVLGLVFAVIAIASDTTWALAAGRFRTWFARSPRRLELVGGAGGLAIIAVGAGLIVSGRKD